MVHGDIGNGQLADQVEKLLKAEKADDEVLEKGEYSVLGARAFLLQRPDQRKQARLANFLVVSLVLRPSGSGRDGAAAHHATVARPKARPPKR